MKKTVTVNLNGRVFTMDDDAYQLLDKYLNNIRIYFRKEEGSSEIIADFEARIEELFSERIRLGYEVITIEQVEEVISRVGKPTDFGDTEQDGREEESKKEEKQSFQQGYRQVKKSFFRNYDNKMLGGVCSGLAAYFDWDVLALRIITIVLMFASSFAIVLVYLLVWLIVPAAKTAAEKLQMQGMPITVENIGKTVAAEAEPVRRSENSGCMQGFLDVIVAIMKICLIGLGCLVGLPLIFAFVILIIALFAVLFGGGSELLNGIPFDFVHDTSFVTVQHPVLASISFIFFIGIPLVVLIYSIVANIAKFKPVDRSVKWIILLVWLLALILLIGSGFTVTKNFSFKGWEYDNDESSNNSTYTEQEYVIDEAFEYIVLDDGLVGNIQIEQGSPTVKVSGPEFWVSKIQHQVTDNQLYISKSGFRRGKWTLNNKVKLDIRISAPNIKGIDSKAIGNVLIPNALSSDDLKLNIKGIGKFQADSLYAHFLKANAEGVGSMVLSGQARRVELDMRGTGSINASGLVADSVFAEVEGVGSVRCYPLTYLKGRVNGIGKLTYKEEPKEKNTEMSGIGHIGKE